MPRFAANLSLMLTELPFLDRFAAAAQAGFGAVECQFPYAWNAAEIAARLAAYGLRQVLFNAPPGDFASGERGIAALPGRETEFMRGLEEALRYARELGCPRLHVMAGLTHQGALRSTYISNLRMAAQRAAVDDIQLLVEPINPRDIPGYLVNRTEQALAILALTAEPNVGLQFDLYHRQIVEGDLTSAVREFGPCAAHVQIAQPPDRGEPDRGEIHYPDVLAALDDSGYDGWVGCEYRPRRGTLDGLTWMDAYRDPARMLPPFEARR